MSTRLIILDRDYTDGCLEPSIAAVAPDSRDGYLVELPTELLERYQRVTRELEQLHQELNGLLDKLEDAGGGALRCTCKPNCSCTHTCRCGCTYHARIRDHLATLTPQP